MEQVTFVLLCIVIVATTACILHFRRSDRVYRKIWELQRLARSFAFQSGCENADVIFQQICRDLRRYNLNVSLLGYKNTKELGLAAARSMEMYLSNLSAFFEIRRTNLTELINMDIEKKSPEICQDQKMAREIVSISSSTFNELNRRFNRFKEQLA